MKKLILKLFGIDLNYYQQIKKYNANKQMEDEFAEFRMLEAKIKDCFNERSYYNEKWMNGFLRELRNYSDSGLPVQRYKELSNKYQLWDEKKYKLVTSTNGGN